MNAATSAAVSGENGIRAMPEARCVTQTTAAARGATLLTGDPELLEARDLGCALEDLRAR